MYEDNFRKALFDALTPEYEKILHDASDDHVFSPKFVHLTLKLWREYMIIRGIVKNFLVFGS